MDAKENLITQFLLKVADKVGNGELAFLRDQLSAVLYNYAVSEIEHTEVAKVYTGETTLSLMKYFAIGKISAGMAMGSLDQYQRTARQLCDFVGKELNMITTEDVRYFLVEYPRHNPTGKVVSMATMDSKRRLLSSIFDYLRKNKKIAENPMDQIDRIKFKKKVKKPLTDAQIEEVKVACEYTGRNRVRNYAMLLFMLDSGVRVSELSNIMLSDVNFEDMSVKVLGKGNKERMVYFSPKTKIRIREYLKMRKDIDFFAETTNLANVPLFASSKRPYTNMSKRAIESMVRSVGKAAGIHTFPHLMRATGATMWHNNGMPIDICAALLGHESIQTTMIYVKDSPEQVKAAYRRYGSVA